MVVPYRRVHRERRITLAPGVGWAFAFIDDERRHAKLLEARAESETCLSGANDHTIGLLCDAKFGPPAVPLRSIVGPPPFVSQRRAVGAASADRFLETNELRRSGQQRPAD